MSERIQVYYNSACPVCKAGIESERCRIEATDADRVEWLDVHAQPRRVEDLSADLEYVRERLHLKTSDGTVHVGLDAFIALFAHTPGRKWLASLLRLPVVHGLGALAYNVFARALYKWNRCLRHW